jgi:hypothetical protein
MGLRMARMRSAGNGERAWEEAHDASPIQIVNTLADRGDSLQWVIWELKESSILGV